MNVDDSRLVTSTAFSVINAIGDTGDFYLVKCLNIVQKDVNEVDFGKTPCKR